MTIEKSCYSFKELVFEKGLFDKSIDATYVIHLEGNGRYENVESQLEEYRITKTNYILFNKGFKKCNKKDIDGPAKDLIDAFLQIFKHANAKNYSNILILEDDFIFDKKIKDEENINNINAFLLEKIDTDFTYLLGTIPFLQLPYKKNHYSLYFSLGSHSCVYSKKNRERVLNSKEVINDWDIYTNLNNFGKRYTYHTPMCYQLFPATDNSKDWGKHNAIFYYQGKLISHIFWHLGLDKKVEPGYTFFYIFSKLILFIVMAILFQIFLSKKIIKYVKKHKYI